MKRLLPRMTLIAGSLLAACSGGETTGQFGRDTVGPASTVDVATLPSMRVVGLTVIVPAKLVSTEKNTYKPVADIVWREDPFGDRHQQVKVIVENAISKGVSSLLGNLPVVLHVEVIRFHALTERTRYSIGGVHEIDFFLTVTNGRTGDTIIPGYLVSASLPAFGGEQALAAERLGLTQKVRITEHLAAVIKQELTGIRAPDLASQPGGAALEFGDELGNELSPFVQEPG